MGIYSLLTTSASGMAAQSALLNTVSDNIANVDTTGYKKATTEFSSLVLNSGLVSDYQSGSVLVDPEIAINGQGAINSTTSPTDLAIQGNGFFVVQGPNNQPVLTRVGSFTENSSGNLVNAAGYTLLGYPVNGSGVANGFTGLVPVNLNNIALQATPTTSGTLYLNLPSTAAVVTNPPSTYTTGTPLPGYTDKTSLVAYDNLGNQVTLDVYSTNLGNNQWEVDAYDAAGATSGGFPYTGNGGAPLTSATLTFNSTGQLSSTSPSPITVPVTNGQSMTLDMSQTTQLATSYTVMTAKTNGNAPSQVSNVNIGTGGTLSAVYQNGSVVPAYNIPLANVISPDNMTVITGNAYQPGLKSGTAQLGVAGTAGLGTIQSNSLEASTVDLASELTTMIAAQNNYQANSKVFNTGSTLLQVLINLGH
ncbi:MAG: flagellar hook protein FlgE [Rhodomicrobium sp.]|jgi:flagellar hook protein FlgE